ncbi:MAG: GNAT family N-acetyltransferase [Chloroflexi bacterium]|nr:GNAT family N-acetyltransferase [Chloroflexota bacterium]
MMEPENREHMTIARLLDSIAGQSYVTPHGVTLRIQLLKPGDEGFLLRLLEHLGPETRLHRFRMSLEQIDKETLQREVMQLVNMDYRNTGAILALIAGNEEPVGVARLARIGDSQEAETAVVVRDDFQRQGIGSWLLALLLSLARGMGFRGLRATVEPYNVGVKLLLQKLQANGCAFKVTTHQGESDIYLDLT